MVEYRFFSQSDEKLIESSELPLTDGIAVAVRTTGFSPDEDEVLELAVVDFEGNELFSRVVKPQNKTEWEASDATGGIAPADVEEAPELYQFEEEISDIFEHASVVVAAHVPFVESMIEASWVTLPKHESFDIIARFLEAHSTADCPNEPAVAATPEGIAAYYGLREEGEALADRARLAAECYKAFVREHAQEREAKGADYWERYERRKFEETAEQRARDEIMAKRERNLNRMNGILWLCGGFIFTSLIIQLYQTGGDMGIMVALGIVAVFCYIRAVMNFVSK
ncbi:MAG: hypothetical protein E7Z99_09855 [Coriobacteriaceae bacterium]|nr:hypothetical protein [Coriobacteriaceae bacterium]